MILIRSFLSLSLVMDMSLLKKLDLSDKEINVYLTLLEYPALSVRGLAELSGLNRGTAYDILKKLQDQGLVSFYHAEKKQKFVAEDPENLIELLRQKELEIKNLEKNLKGLVPELKSLQDKGGDKPATKFYEGFQGIRKILEDVLETMVNSNEKQYFVYSAKNASEDINQALPDYTKKRIKAGIEVQVLSLAQGGKLSGLDERKWLGTNDESATFIILYNGKCAYIARDSLGKPMGVVIENNLIYKTQTLIFRQIWQMTN